MLASMQEFITNLTSWLPQALQHIGELVVYYALLTALMLIPIGLWFAYAVGSTRRRQRDAGR
jgi:ABC-type proline/glycine betaine transport system permease subunit